MLVWDAPQGTPNIFAMAGAGLRSDARSAYEGYLCCVNRIILRESERFIFLPNKLSAAMIGAFFILDDPIFNGLAISLIFGILVSTLLTLVVIPVLYCALYRKRVESRESNAEAAATSP